MTPSYRSKSLHILNVYENSLILRYEFCVIEFKSMYIKLKQILKRLTGLPLFTKIVPFLMSGLTLPSFCPASLFLSRYVQSIGPGIEIGGQSLKSIFYPRVCVFFLILLLILSSNPSIEGYSLAFFNIPTITQVMPKAGKVEDLNLFGMYFSFDTESEAFCLIDKPLSTEDLFNISNDVFGSLNSINEKGYVTLESLEESSHFIRSIEFQLVVLGYERKQFGDSNNTYSL